MKDTAASAKAIEFKQWEKVYLRQLAIALRDSCHSVSSLQNLSGQPGARYMRLTHLSALTSFLATAGMLNDELQKLYGMDEGVKTQ